LRIIVNQDQPSINSHVKDYLNYYCRLNQAPGFAVLLKGEWGAGKTHFIKKYIDDIRGLDPVISNYSLPLKSLYIFFIWFNKQININMGKVEAIHNQKIYYLSLHSTQNTSEVEERILTSVAKSQDSALPLEQLQQLFKAMGEVFKGIKRVDISKIVSSDYFIQNILPKSSVLVFDDLERCKISCANLFGFINHFVEQQGLKVIIIANERKLEEDDNYKFIKEKLVGQTLEIHPDFDDVLKNLLSKVNHVKSRKFLHENIEQIKKYSQKLIIKI
jgi:hypothetical protein